MITKDKEQMKNIFITLFTSNIYCNFFPIFFNFFKTSYIYDVRYQKAQTRIRWIPKDVKGLKG